MSGQKKPFNVAIVGGGLVGAVLTRALLDRNINVQVYEKGESFSEISASLGVNANAVRALKLCGQATYDACKSVSVKPPDSGVLFKFVDGYNVPPMESWAIPVGGDESAGGVHRGLFLEALVKSLPDDIVHFGKGLQDVEEPADGQEGPLKLLFADGTTATADAVIGCDGVGSHVRRHILGADHPAARARYAHRYCYRALVPMEAAAKALGEHVESNTMWLGKDTTCVTIPIVNRTFISISAFVEDPEPWSSEHHTVLPATKEDFVASYSHWNPQMRALIENVTPKMDRWGLFDFAENPVPYYAKGRIAIAGDAAHATTPHLGSGAGFGFEDAAVLAELLADEHMTGAPAEIEAAFQAYNEIRQPRGEWLPGASRRNGSLMEMRDPTAGADGQKIREKLSSIFEEAWSGDPVEFARLARESFKKRIGKL